MWGSVILCGGRLLCLLIYISYNVNLTSHKNCLGKSYKAKSNQKSQNRYKLIQKKMFTFFYKEFMYIPQTYVLKFSLWPFMRYRTHYLYSPSSNKHQRFIFFHEYLSSLHLLLLFRLINRRQQQQAYPCTPLIPVLVTGTICPLWF